MTETRFFGKHEVTGGSMAEHGINGERWTAYFPNGWGVSIVRVPGFSYGGDEGRWEVGLLRHGGADGHEGRLSGDPVGWLTDRQVAAKIAGARRRTRK